MKPFVTLLALCCLATPLFAQTPNAGTSPVDNVFVLRPTDGRDALEGPQVLDYSLMQYNSPAGKASLRAFHDAKAAGLLPRTGKRAQRHAIGSVISFNVLTDIVTGAQWETRDFTLQASNSLANIWLATAEVNDVDPADLVALEEALLSKTPPDSFNPNQGVIENDNEVYGDPPNFDGDGIVDVLVYNIFEGEGAPDGVFVLGFVSPADTDPNAPAGVGNQADVLHLDTNPLITDPGRFGRGPEFAHLTAAHEYQHLIHNNYDPFESSFVNEAQSEWAEYVNGYQGRFVSYLLNAGEHNIDLLDFREQGLIDRQRGTLFHNYLAEQLGIFETGSITRSDLLLEGGYADALDGSADGNAGASGEASFREQVVNFHLANFINDTSVDARYGYTNPLFANVRAIPTVVVDGRSLTETATTNVTLNPGAVQYLAWDDVEDITIDIDANADASVIDFVRARLSLHAILEPVGGPMRLETITPGVPQSFAGAYARVTIAAIHNQPGSSAAAVRYAATWTGSGQGATVQTLAYDDENIKADVFFSLSAGVDGAVATRFEVPIGGSVVLDKLRIVPFFLSHFSNGGQDPGAPRDLTVTIWDDNGGVPGDAIFSVEASGFPLGIDGSCATVNCPITNFTEVDLSAFANELNNLPPVIYIGYTETGTDSNFMVVGPSNYSTENVSFIGNLGASPPWSPLWNVTLSSGTTLENTVIPIRAEFLVGGGPTPVEDDPTLPTAVTLAPNYPNPFNPSTEISFALSRTSDVRLAVYDVLGREVAVLAEGPRPAGTHTATFDATGQASGLYLYRLEAEGRTLTRTMMLVK